MDSSREENEIINLDFFPIGIYNAEPSGFEELREIGFNSVCVSARNPESLISILKSARQSDMRVLISTRNLNALFEFTPGTEGKTSGLSRISAENLSPFSGSILGWYLEDEPEGRSISPKEVFLRKILLRKNGLRQLGAIALNRSWRAADYAASTDVIMSDPYPIPFNPLSWLSLSLDEIHETLEGDPLKKVWAVIQAFDWNSLSQKIAREGLGREPSPEELRALTYLAVIHRAQGLFYYTFRSGRYFIREKTGIWEGLKETVREMRRIYPLILLPELKEGVSMECNERDEWDVPVLHSFFPQGIRGSCGRSGLQKSRAGKRGSRLLPRPVPDCPQCGRPPCIRGIQVERLFKRPEQRFYRTWAGESP
jgi:hypothetical protein